MIIKRIKKISTLFIGMLGILGTVWAVYGPIRYAVEIPTHPAIDETRVGFIRELKKQGFVIGKNINIHIESQGGNLITIQKAEDSHAKIGDKIHLAIGTSIAQSVLKNMGNEAVLIFSSVTDPVGAGLIMHPEKPEGKVTGVSNFIPALPQLNFFKSLYPELKKIAFIYNPAEANSLHVFHDLMAVAHTLEIEVVPIVINSGREISAAIKEMPTVNGIYTNNDNTVASEFGELVRLADERKIPVFVSDLALIKYGALAAYGADQFEVGKATATMVIRLLKGEKIENIPMVTVNTPNRSYNQEKGKLLNIHPSAKVLKEVEHIWPQGWLQSFKTWIKEVF